MQGRGTSSAAPSDTGDFNAELAAAGRKLQWKREQADYDAWDVPAEEARRVIELAREFVRGIEEMIAG